MRGVKMLSQQDLEKLNAAQQAVDLAKQAVMTLHKAEDQMLAEHASDLIETLAKMNQKLIRLLAVAQSN